MNKVARAPYIKISLLLVIFAVISSTSVWTNHDARKRLEATQRSLDAVTAQISQLRAELDRLNQQAESAHQELATLYAANDHEGGATQEVEIKSWLARLKRIKLLFAQRDDQRIPELQFLGDREWLLIGKTAKLDTDEHIREALAKARNDARWIFARRMNDALSKYKKAFNNELPPATLALAPYFSVPVDESLLRRYELVASGKVQSGRAGAIPAIREKTPIDPDYDNRVQIHANGGMSSGSPLDWVEGFSERSAEAYRSYAKENSGASPPNVSSLLPYFSPPLDPATREKVIRLDQKR